MAGLLPRIYEVAGPCQPMWVALTLCPNPRIEESRDCIPWLRKEKLIQKHIQTQHLQRVRWFWGAAVDFS